MTALWAESSVHFDGKTFSELALAGDKGVIVALIIAYIALILVFAALYAFSRWCEVRRYERREIGREKELIELRNEENLGRERLVKAQTELANHLHCLTELVGDIAEEVREVNRKTDAMTALWEG